MDYDLANKVAVVSGAGGGGIGTAVCLEMARRGATIVANDMDRNRADAVVKDVIGLGGKAVASYGDVTRISGCRDMVHKAVLDFGRVDILVTIPAFMVIKMFAHYTQEEMQKQVDVTFWGTVNTVKAVLEPMMRQRRGSIILMGSDSARMAPAMETLYAASKSALMTFASSLSKEIGHHGLRINVVNAALVRTPTLAVGAEEAFAPNYALGRLAESKEVAELILFLASDRASFITGQSISVNGGRI